MKEKSLVHIIEIVIFIVLLYAMAYAGPNIDPFGGPNPQVPVDTAISPSFDTNQVALTASATLIKAAPNQSGQPTNRFSIMITNLSSTNIVYLGNSSAVTASTGDALLPYQTKWLDRSYSAVYGICASAQTATVSYLDEAK